MVRSGHYRYHALTPRQKRLFNPPDGSRLAPSVPLGIWPYNAITKWDSMSDDSSRRVRIIDLQWRDVPNGYECEAVVEMTRMDGSTTVIREFWRQIDVGASYVTIRHAVRNSALAQTSLVFGQKGEVEGDFRTDRTEMLTFQLDGTVRRTEQTVKTWLKGDAIREKMAGWYRDGAEIGMTPDQIVRLIWNLESSGPEQTASEGQ